jgi:hypothetical protein
MIIQVDRNVTTESTSNTCAYHKKNPLDVSYPGCTCSGGVFLRSMTAEEIAERDAKEAKELEARERAELLRLKAKYK